MRPILPLALLLFACATPVLGAKARESAIQPGPSTMSPEEAALAADPAAEVEDAVVLVEEIEREDTDLGGSRTRYHLRAKILSNESRDLADVSIPLFSENAKLEDWWGRTILPDGRVLELKQGQLTEQRLGESRDVTITARKGALPGVVPGAVIDYGYQVSNQGLLFFDQIMLQRDVPLRSFRLHWKPSRVFSGHFEVLNGEGRDVQVEHGSDFVTVTARNLRPVRDEPMMPPPFMTRSLVLLYYMYGNATPVEFWNRVAVGTERGTTEFLSRDGVKKLVAAIGAPETATLDEKLHAAYAWIESNIRNTAMLTSEETETLDEEGEDENPKNTLKYVLTERSGSSTQIARAFIGAARAYGAEAALVLAGDRRASYFRPQILSLGQLGWRLVAVRAPGGEWTLLAPGRGLSYGVIPWWLTGVTGVLTLPKKAETLALPPSPPGTNVLRTTAAIRFTDDNATVAFDWKLSGTGNVGYSERLAYRAETPDQRRKRLDDVCGATFTSLEIVTAEAPAAQDLAKPLEVSCAGEYVGASVDEDIDTYSFSPSGPWFAELPDVTAATRKLPVISDYPSDEDTVVEIAAPSGFVPDTPPDAIVLESPWGQYARTTTATASGFRIERSLTRAFISVKPEAYAKFREWITAIDRADEEPVRFRRKGES